MTDLTVVCWLWNGWRPVYTAAHVNALHSMVQTHLHIPHRFVCVTDQPAGIECETMKIWSWPDVKTAPRAPNCYRRLRLFAPDAARVFGPRMLSIDLDCVILDDITPLITPDEFRIVKGYISPYNGSMWLLSAGTRPTAYNRFHAERSPIRTRARGWYGSDQSWIAHTLPDEPTWGAADGVHLFHELTLAGHARPTAPRVIFFPGTRKPWDDSVKREYPHIYNAYMKHYPTNGTIIA